MIPYYAEFEQVCEQCEGDIYHGYEFLIYDGMKFHHETCLINWIYENAPYKKYYLSNNKEDKNNE